ncbi:hypothetical protein H9P43_007052 [Blastocladiella emersonii ATCC 22665]|nr:hypothetical protein H9P43_007052 [Blastocladiella emersonii ATCC 22665]
MTTNTSLGSKPTSPSGSNDNLTSSATAVTETPEWPAATLPAGHCSKTTGEPWDASSVALPAFVETETASIAGTVADVRGAWTRTRALYNLEFRRAQLRAFARLVDENEDALCAALCKDLHKSRGQAILTEVGLLATDIAGAVKHLDSWAKPVAPRRAMINLIDSVTVRKDPLGVVLVIGAWNYPILLTLAPVVAAMAAGNAAVIKPSEVAPAVAAVIADLVPRYLDARFFRVVNGGVPQTTELLRHRFDHIFYTGNGAVGRIVMTAAAKHLTPVTLELGGKSPAIVHPSADLGVTARRIAWGKFLNAGQTCVAPDYVLVRRDMQAPLVAALKAAVAEFFGGDDAKASADYSRIINERHFDRLAKYKTTFDGKAGGTVAFGDVAGWDRAARFIPPTVIADVTTDAAIMDDEIFGPLLPIIPLDVDESSELYADDESGVPGGDAFMRHAAALVGRRDHPLALYVFARNAKAADWLLAHTASGGVAVNDCVIHLATQGLPFGGVGGSGMGKYHGQYGFDTFSHDRAVLRRPMGLEIANMPRYPPVTNRMLGLIKMFMMSKV